MKNLKNSSDLKEVYRYQGRLWGLDTILRNIEEIKNYVNNT